MAPVPPAVERIRDSMCVDVAIWLACILDDGDSLREDTHLEHLNNTQNVVQALEGIWMLLVTHPGQ